MGLSQSSLSKEEQSTKTTVGRLITVVSLAGTVIAFVCPPVGIGVRAAAQAGSFANNAYHGDRVGMAVDVVTVPLFFLPPVRGASTAAVQAEKTAASAAASRLALGVAATHVACHASAAGMQLSAENHRGAVANGFQVARKGVDYMDPTFAPTLLNNIESGIKYALTK